MSKVSMLRRLINLIVFPYKKIKKDRTLRGDLALIRSSGLFDEAWYLAHNPDVAQAKVDPLLHYLNDGGFEGRDPGPSFTSALYLDAYEDVRKAGINPLLHYLRYGQKDGRMAQPQIAEDLYLLQSSCLFDGDWYLANNPDLAQAGIDPTLHYLHFGGFEGRDPGPNFSSKRYLNAYEDVKKSRINPLIHYLRYGQKEGYKIQSPSPYRCPVCQNEFNEFLPITAFFQENDNKYGYPYAYKDTGTLNAGQYGCPHCKASDRDRLYACYLEERLPQYNAGDQILLLDIAPSLPFGNFLNTFKNITYQTAGLHLEGGGRVPDITNMPEIDSDSFDIVICSDVLEHVNDDKKALSELYRVLKPGGWGIIMVPINLTIDQIDGDPEVIDVAERRRRLGQNDHTRLYNKSGFIERVESAGFTLYQFGMDYFGESAFRKYGITSKSVLYIAGKPLDKKSNSKILTVIIITYNQKDYIAKALDSVLEQETTYPYEIWLCDDCSTDGTTTICNDYAKRYPDKIKFFPQPVNTWSDPGKAFHGHIALRSVNTKYVCILEGDDAWCDNKKIQIALDILENNPGYVTFAHDTLYNDNVNKTKKSLVHEIYKTEIKNPVTFKNALYLHTSSRIHRNIFKFSENPETYIDLFMFYIFLNEGPLYYYDKIMSVYNVTGKGMWSNLSDMDIKKALDIQQYELNKFFNYKHDVFFTSRIGEKKTLELLKKIYGRNLGWKLWYILTFNDTVVFLQNLPMKIYKTIIRKNTSA
jgi:glycosyltransferase involved in cell wall biosynthesis/SAM-dependent methyltransferase